ncbi:hypothetical protein [Actinoallomurus sp. CA-150999]|uniref:hypothetical protein n=1 Tax=Actinoallomurus sp. CA-150999 TaxID=3239887 RepID=UPI003D89DA45
MIEARVPVGSGCAPPTGVPGGGPADVKFGRLLCHGPKVEGGRSRRDRIAVVVAAVPVPPSVRERLNSQKIVKILAMIVDVG